MSSLSESTAIWAVPMTLALGLAGLLIVGVVRRRRAAPVTESSAMPEASDRDELIMAIAELDDRLERGEVTEREHNSQRQILKAQLLEHDMSARETLEK